MWKTGMDKQIDKQEVITATSILCKLLKTANTYLSYCRHFQTVAKDVFVFTVLMCSAH